MEATELREQLCAAIRRRSLVMFEYGDLIRVVEPHRFGINSAGHEMLSGKLRAGYSRSDPAGGWRNYLLSDVRALQVLDAPFAGTRPGYVAHDPRMREVYCELELTEAATPTQGPFIVREAVGPDMALMLGGAMLFVSEFRRQQRLRQGLGAQGSGMNQ